MISLQINGKYLDIAPKEKITIEWVSTVFNDETELLGSYSYPVQCPFTDNNDNLLGFARFIQNRSARYDKDVIIEIGGQPWKQAKLSFDVTPDGYETNCFIDNAEFAKLLKDKLLPDIFAVYEDGIFKDFTWDLLGSSQQETLTNMIYRATNPGEGSCVFYAQKNDFLFGADGSADLGFDNDYYINHYNNNTIDELRSNQRKAFYIPSFYLRWVIKKVCNYLGFEATGDFFSDPAVASLVIDNNGFLDAATIFDLKGCKIAPARHLPKIKLSDFIKTLRSTFKLALYFDGNERKAYFNYARQIITGDSEVDISRHTEPGITIRAYKATGYELTQGLDEADDLFTTFQYVKTYLIGDDTEPQKLSAFTGTLFMTDVTEPRPLYNTTWRVPRKRQLGNGYTNHAEGTDAYNDSGYSKNDFALRLLNYAGMAADSGYNLYSYAHSDGKYADGNDHPTDLAMWLGGKNGIINTFLKDWYLFYLRTQEVELTAHLSANLVHKLSPLKRLVWTGPDQVRTPALISQVTFEKSDDFADLISAKLRVYPIFNQAATDVKAFTQFTPGQIENEGRIYVKFRLVEVNRTTKTSAGYQYATAIYSEGYLDFYSDAACTKSRNVSNLPVNMIYNYRGKNARNYIIDDHHQVHASGTSHQIIEDWGIDQTYKFDSDKDYWTKYYSIAPGPDYTIVS